MESESKSAPILHIFYDFIIMHTACSIWRVGVWQDEACHNLSLLIIKMILKRSFQVIVIIVIIIGSQSDSNTAPVSRPIRVSVPGEKFVVIFNEVVKRLVVDRSVFIQRNIKELCKAATFLLNPLSPRWCNLWICPRYMIRMLWSSIFMFRFHADKWL